MENLVIYDWLSITSRMHTPQDMIDFIGLESVPWQQTKGAHGYKDRLYWNCISIHYNGSPDQGVWLEMSGQGCRAFETFGHGSYEHLFREILRNKDLMKITRLDVAFDDHTGLLDMNVLTFDTLSGHYIAKATAWEVIQSNKGQSIVIGSPQSAVLIRIYDKARERNCGSGTHWIRIELQLRDDRALKFVELNKPIGESFSGVLYNYLRYVLPDPEDTNKSRWSMSSYWSNLLGEVERLKIYESPGVEYNVDRCEDFVFNHCGNAIDALLQAYPVEYFLKKLAHRGIRWNPKYDLIADQARHAYEWDLKRQAFDRGEVIDLG